MTKIDMSNRKNLLLIEDGKILGQVFSEQLQLHEEFTITCVRSGAEGLESAKAEYYDVIILDVGLPDMDGHEVCRLMRRSGIKSPIITLTGANTNADTILSLVPGANDYITKPFRLNALLARIRAHIRQHERGDDAVFVIGPYSFHTGVRLLVDDAQKKKVRLTAKEAAILKYLYRANDQVVGREILLDEVWGYNAGVTTHTLETHVYRLRQKIERDPSNARILVTEPGGYRLVP
jgi:DNA-binding response OmpR family regulator